MGTFVQNHKVVQLAQPKTTNGGFTSDWLDLKDAHRAIIICEVTQAVGHATAFTLNRATATTPAGNTTLGNNVKIWANEDVATSDTLVAQADAKAHTVDAEITNKTIVFEIDPSTLGDNGASPPVDYKAVAVVVSDSSQATNFASITAIIETRYKQATPPAAI